MINLKRVMLIITLVFIPFTAHSKLVDLDFEGTVILSTPPDFPPVPPLFPLIPPGAEIQPVPPGTRVQGTITYSTSGTPMMGEEPDASIFLGNTVQFTMNNQNFSSDFTIGNVILGDGVYSEDDVEIYDSFVLSWSGITLNDHSVAYNLTIIGEDIVNDLGVIKDDFNFDEEELFILLTVSEIIVESPGSTKVFQYIAKIDSQKPGNLDFIIPILNTLLNK